MKIKKVYVDLVVDVQNKILQTAKENGDDKTANVAMSVAQAIVTGIFTAVVEEEYDEFALKEFVKNVNYPKQVIHDKLGRRWTKKMTYKTETYLKFLENNHIEFFKIIADNGGRGEAIMKLLSSSIIGIFSVAINPEFDEPAMAKLMKLVVDGVADVRKKEKEL